MILRDWRVLLKLPFWLANGKARLKQELAARWDFRPDLLPYNQPLLGYLKTEHARADGWCWQPRRIYRWRSG